MPKHKNQRVGVFIDIQNLYYSAKQFYKSKVNFAYILHRAVSNRQLIRAIAYVIKADIKEESNFFDALEKIGYDVRSKDLQTFYGGAKKGDWDVGIAMDIMRMAAKLDVIVLVSGDGDFKDLLEHVKALGCRAEVIAFKKTCSSRLLGEADEFIDLDKELEQVLIKHNRDFKSYNIGTVDSKPTSNGSKKSDKSNKSDSKSNNDKKSGRTSSRKRSSKSSSKKSEKSDESDKSKKSGYKKPQSRDKRKKSYSKKGHSRNRKPYSKSSYRSSDEDMSLIQKLNMDQPEIKIPQENESEEKSSGKTKKKSTKSKTAKKKSTSKKSAKKTSSKKTSKKSSSKKSSGKKKSSKKTTKSKSKKSAKKTSKKSSKTSRTAKKSPKQGVLKKALEKLKNKE